MFVALHFLVVMVPMKLQIVEKMLIYRKFFAIKMCAYRVITNVLLIVSVCLENFSIQ